MSARFVTGSSGGRADTARRCVPRWRFRASAIRRGSAEHPRDNSQRPYAESDLDRVHRCVAFQDVASDGASIDVRLRDANDRRWLAGSAPALPATGATTTAKTAKTDGQLGESASSNERGRRVGGAGQESRAGGLDASPGADRTAAPVLMTARIACRVPAGDANVNDFWPDAILARHSGQEVHESLNREAARAVPHEQRDVRLVPAEKSVLVVDVAAGIVYASRRWSQCYGGSAAAGMTTSVWEVGPPPGQCLLLGHPSASESLRW